MSDRLRERRGVAFERVLADWLNRHQYRAEPLLSLREARRHFAPDRHRRAGDQATSLGRSASSRPDARPSMVPITKVAVVKSARFQRPFSASAIKEGRCRSSAGDSGRFDVALIRLRAF
jgi:hypothetical protein